MFVSPFCRKLFSNELELAANTALVKCLQEIKLEFETTAAAATKEKELLYNKYQKIQDFKHLTVSTVCAICKIHVWE